MFRNLYKGWKNKGKTQQSDKEDRKEEVFQKMNEGLTGLERHARVRAFLGELSLQQELIYTSQKSH